MTAEGNVHDEVSESSKGEIEVKCGLDMSSYEDLPNVGGGGGGECNVVSHHEEGHEGKDHSDNSYVFVSGSDVAADDLGERDLNADHVNELSVSEPIVGSNNEEVKDGGGELKVVNGESVGSYDCIVEGTDVSPVVKDDVPGETLVGNSNGVIVGGSDTILEQNQTVATESEPPQGDSEVKVEGQIKLESSVEVEDGQIDQAITSEEAESELPSLDNGEVKDEEQNNVHSITEAEEAESELPPLDNGEVKDEEQNNVDSITEVEEAVPKLPHLDNGKVKDEEQNNVHSITEAEEAEYESPRLENGEVKEEEKNNIHSITEAEEAEPKLPRLENREVKDEEQNSVDSITEAEEAEPELPHLDNGAVKDEEQNNVDSITEAEEAVPKLPHLGNGAVKDEEQNSVDSITEAEEAEPELPHLDNGAVKDEEQNSVDSITEAEEAEPELPHLDNGAVKDEVQNSVDSIREAKEAESELPHLDNGKVRDEVQNSVDSIREAEESQQPQLATTKLASSEVNNGELGEGEGEGKGISESAVDTQENLEAENLISEDVQLDQDQEKEAIELHKEIPAEGPPEELGLQTEPTLKMASSPPEVPNCSPADENGDNLCAVHVADSVPEPGVTSVSIDGSQKTPELDGFANNAERLPLPVNCMRSETEIGCVPIESDESLIADPDGDSKCNSATGVSLNIENESNPSCTTEVEKLDAKSGEGILDSPVDDLESEIEVVNGLVDVDCALGHPTNDLKSEPVIDINVPSSEEKASPVASGVASIEPEVSNGVTEIACSQPTSADDLLIESPVKDLVEKESSMPTCPGAGVRIDSEVENKHAYSTGVDMVSHDATALSKSEVLDGSLINADTALSCAPDNVDVNNVDESTAKDSDDQQICQEKESSEGIHKDETATSSQEDLKADALDSQDASTDVVKKQFYYLVKVPRYDDENIREQIKHAKQEVDKETIIREAVLFEKPTIKAARDKYRAQFEDAKSEEAAARELLKSKRREIDSAQSVINRAKNAMSVIDIDSEICDKEHRMQHATLDLKEEKLFIRKIKQLKQQREQISSNLGGQDEVQQALDQRGQIEERFKDLQSMKKEVDLLRENVFKAEAVTKAARNNFYEAADKFRELQAKYSAADVVRQVAYSHLQKLKKDFYEKNKYFRKYKEDQKAANEYAFAGDRDAVQRICINQMETVMEEWNKNDEFRKEYTSSNLWSTIRRLKTLDGRSLGPDEEPPALPIAAHRRVDKSINAQAGSNSVSTCEQEKVVDLVQAQKADDKSMEVLVEQKNETVKTKKPARPSPLVSGSATVSGRDQAEEAEEEAHKLKKEEVELARKVEELRKQEEEAKLKEQRRLEEKAKAKEALERKKRGLEKAQARAESRAKKEAEQKEKERERRAKKKEKKKAAGAEEAKGEEDEEDSLAPISETPTENVESGIREKLTHSLSKRPQKPSKLTKAKSTLPPPLRNRGKRRMQPWMWVLLTALLVIALFLLGNSGSQHFHFY